MFRLELDEHEAYNLAPERKLWRAVLSMAFIDALCQHEGRVSAILKTKAHRWFIDGGKDFDDVCHLAGFTGAYVRRKYEELLKSRAIKFSPRQARIIGKYWADLTRKNKK